LVSATALTYKLGAHEKACFYSNVENKGAKIAFYFAVGGLQLAAVIEYGLMKSANRYKLEVLSMLTMRLLDLVIRSSWMVKRRDKATSFLPRAILESTSSASTIR